MNTIATAEIAPATTNNRLIVEERYLKLNYPASERATKKTYTHQEAWEMVEKRLSDYYGVEIKFEKALGIDSRKHAQYPEGWDDAFSSEEFLFEAKKMLKKKFDDRTKVS